jgi:hypothetical protein
VDVTYFSALLVIAVAEFLVLCYGQAVTARLRSSMMMHLLLTYASAMRWFTPCTSSAQNERKFMAYPSYCVFELHVFFFSDVRKASRSQQDVCLRLPKVHTMTITSHINRKATAKLEYYSSVRSCKPHPDD